MRSLLVVASSVCLLAAACGSKQQAETTPAASAPPAASAAPTASAAAENKPLLTPLDADAIAEAVSKQAQAFDECYTLGANKEGKLFGTVKVRATVGPKGEVTETSIVSSTMKNHKVDACVAEAFKKVKFPAPEGGSSVITFPMQFGGEEVRK
jgi:TonB family protein